MQVRIQDNKDVTICYISGDVDINSAPQVKKTFDKIISDKKNKILVNFKETSYIDSSGLATLVELLKNVRSYGGKLKLSNLSTKVRSLFEITKLEKLFSISEDENEALASY